MSEILTSDIKFNLAFNPIMVLSVYESEYDYRENSHYYIERRLVKKDGSLGEAAPLKHSTLKNIAKAITKDLKPKIYIKGIIHPRVLAMNTQPEQESLVWICPEHKERLIFTDNVGVPDGEYPIPHLIFKVSGGGNVAVWSILTDNPTENTDLYHAPFPNIGGGGVCMGSAAVHWKGSKSEKELIEEVEMKFFQSRFSHNVGSNQVVKGNYVVAMKNLNGHFPGELLMKTKKKLKDAIRE